MPTTPREVKKKKIPNSQKVVIASLAGMISSTLFHPLDLIKVRLQVYRKPGTSSQMADKVVKCDGLKALYRGLGASLLRQATYTPTRLGAYYFLYDEFIHQQHRRPSLNEKVWFGVISGVVAALVGNPSEVALVRLMADGPNGGRTHPYRRRYQGLFDLFSKVIKQEGVRALWRGGFLTLMRTIFLSIIQIETYVHSQQALKRHHVDNEIELRLYTSILTSLATSSTSIPVDVVKTLYQVRSDDRSQREIWVRLARKRGLLFLWQGFFPYFSRLTCHTFVTFYILEQLCDIYIFMNIPD